LEEQIQAFTRLSDMQRVQIILKKPFGKGGILDFLRTASVAAPSVLPDLVTIHSDELAVAARAGILQPLDPFVPSDLQSDLFPFAWQAGQVDGTLYGLPWDADIEHLAYDTRVITSSLGTWDEVLASQATFAIPGAGVEGRVNDSFLIQYIGAGGRIEQGASALIDGVALRRVLDFLAVGRQSGRIPESVLSLPDPAACWAALIAGDVQMAQVRASQYLSGRAQAGWVGYAATPTWDGRTVTIGQGWMLAIVTQEPARQTQAAGLIAWLLRPEHAGEWTLASGRLPTRRAALALWDAQDSYVPFVRQQLEVALPRPHDEQFATLSRALQWAERQILSGNAPPEQVVADVLAEVTP
jgi:multiple sugar transport system substrate-binding protein/arabinogalactan oligomer/maltooligosaccharide transport system substrate-binding protein